MGPVRDWGCLWCLQGLWGPTRAWRSYIWCPWSRRELPRNTWLLLLPVLQGDGSPTPARSLLPFSADPWCPSIRWETSAPRGSQTSGATWEVWVLPGWGQPVQLWTGIGSEGSTPSLHVLGSPWRHRTLGSAPNPGCGPGTCWPRASLSSSGPTDTSRCAGPQAPARRTFASTWLGRCLPAS